MSCTCRKVVYLSEREAKTALRRTQRRVSGAPAKGKPYRCPGDPKLWHLGSQGRRPWKSKID